MQAFGPLPRSVEVCHTCDIRNCVRLSHLFLDDHAGNMRDAAQKERMAQRLGWSQVLAIRESVEPASVLARKYGCHIRTVYDIRTGRRRTHPPRMNELERNAPKYLQSSGDGKAIASPWPGVTIRAGS
jgi:hypothetical protein